MIGNNPADIVLTDILKQMKPNEAKKVISLIKLVQYKVNKIMSIDDNSLILELAYLIRDKSLVSADHLRTRNPELKGFLHNVIKANTSKRTIDEKKCKKLNRIKYIGFDSGKTGKEFTLINEFRIMKPKMSLRERFNLKSVDSIPSISNNKTKE